MMKTIAVLTIGIVFGFVIGGFGSNIQQESPYLKHPDRLGDVVAAILVMGTYKFDNNYSNIWEEKIGAGPKSADSWADVFEEHPEFFRTSKEDYKEGSEEDSKVSLVWRRARNWSWDTVDRKEIVQEKLNDWPAAKKNKRLSRRPLDPEETTKLVEIALNMQTQAIARREERRWWVPLAVGFVGVLIGALLKTSGTRSQKTDNVT